MAIESQPAGCYIGIDIGGTSIKGILVSETGKAIARDAAPTAPQEGAVRVLAKAASLVLGFKKKAAGRIFGAGIGTPGGVNLEGVIVGEAANIPGWIGTRLGGEIQAGSGIPCFVENDANLAAYGEYAAIAGKSPRSLFFLGLGTGLGGGIISEGRIVPGIDSMAGEIGHVIIVPDGRRCPCGLTGCAERYVSAQGIVASCLEMALRYDTPFSRQVNAAPASITAKSVYEAYALQDPLAQAVHALTCEMLARTAGIAMTLLAPEIVVFGGGVLSSGEAIVEGVRQRIRSYALPAVVAECRFARARLGAEAGLFGAAIYAATRIAGADGFERMRAGLA
jgi:glucokinase